MINVLNGESINTIPFICPGGMMNMVLNDIFLDSGYEWDKIHTDASAMAQMALLVRKAANIDNVGVPFCMTVEAQDLGAVVDCSISGVEPQVMEYPMEKADDWVNLAGMNLDTGRASIIINSIRLLAEEKGDYPVIANLTGPISLATSLIEPMKFYLALRNNPIVVKQFLDFICENLIKFAKEMALAGADILTIADPSASGEILGPQIFKEYAVPYINEIITNTNDCYKAKLVHICGNLKNVFNELNQLKTKAISIDSSTSVVNILKSVPDKVIVGNVSTHTLLNGTSEQVLKASQRCIKQGVKVLAPACGLSTLTPAENLLAMAQAAKMEMN